MKFITPGIVTAGLSVCAVLAGAFGKTALAAFFNDPATAQSLLVVIGSAGTLVSGAMAGVKQG